MTNIDKNPRQITRLRVEDQKKLEELATKLTYNSSTDTTEIGTSLYVNGSIKSTDAIMLYNDTQLTFYIDKENSEDVTISPMFGYEGITQLSFSYTLPDGTETYSAYLNLDRTSHILTDQNTKKLFGNSLYGTGNIDLYNHIISIDINATILLNIFVKASSSNLKVNSLNDLTTLLNAKENTIIECNAYNEGQTFTRNVDITGLIYTNSTWKYGMVYMTPQGPFIDNEALITTATINDVVTPL